MDYIPELAIFHGISSYYDSVLAKFFFEAID
jgi:hypothetical protein